MEITVAMDYGASMTIEMEREFSFCFFFIFTFNNSKTQVDASLLRNSIIFFHHRTLIKK